MSDTLAAMYRRAESMQVDSTSWVGSSNFAMGTSLVLYAVERQGPDMSHTCSLLHILAAMLAAMSCHGKGWRV